MAESTSRSTATSDMSPASAAIQAAKKTLRQKIKANLNKLDDASLASQAASVTSKILSHPSYANAKRLSIYISMPTAEMRTDNIVKDALKQQKKLFIPYTPPGKNSRMQMIQLRDLQDYESLIPNSWGIREFPKDTMDSRENALNAETREALDLILMPGLAFDRRLDRLGHGRGYYDTYLSLCAQFSLDNGLQRPKTIALALNEQILPEGEYVPTITVEDGHTSGHRDIKPDSIVYPHGELQLP